MGKMVLQY